LDNAPDFGTMVTQSGIDKKKEREVMIVFINFLCDLCSHIDGLCTCTCIHTWVYQIQI